MNEILVTGGAGYIGSHVAASLLAAGYGVTVIDNFSNSSPEAVANVNLLGAGAAHLIVGDCRDKALVETIFSERQIAGVVHLAGLKAVGESVERPDYYYDVNFGSALTIVQAMLRHRCQRFVFSSSATVYGDPGDAPATEDAPTGPTNPYGQTKLMIEQLLSDVAAANDWFQVVSLRYFNPAGAHPSALIGENPNGIPNNLFPIIARVASGQMPEVRIFGDDWSTPDGTGIRDYIHVMDLAEGHVAAMNHLMQGGAAGENLPLNLGAGAGVSVRQAIDAFAEASGRPVPSSVADRRPGDVARIVADPSRAEQVLGWRTTRGFDAICADHWAAWRYLTERNG